MAVPSNNGLLDYFQWLSGELAQGKIVSEKDLEHTVDIPPYDYRGIKTLLQILGYDRSEVRTQFAIQIGTRTHWVDYLIQPDRRGWMLDLKAPPVDCTSSKYAAQLQSYLRLTNVALGLLFNGHKAAAYVNPALRRIGTLQEELQREFQIDLARQPVRTAEIQKPDEMVSFFSLFSVVGSTLDPDRLAITLAKDLLTSLRKQRSSQERTKHIKAILQSMLQNPDPAVVSAILSAYPDLSSLSAKPGEIRAVLRSLVVPVSPPKPPPSARQEKVNPRIRDLVARVCADPSLGYAALSSHSIPGLRMRLGGGGTQGYRAVPPGPGVPQHLCVQGVDAPRATQIIAALEQLLKVTNS
jgi:hypothetical protein